MISLNGLSKSFGDRVILDNVSLNVSKGEKLAFIGRNGQGKSTLFKLILGEEEEDAGDISAPRNYQIGHLAQHVSFSEDTVLKEATVFLETESENYQAERILMGLGFSIDEFSKSPKDLSSGFKLRLELAKTLVRNPNLLLLDEPTNYLDILSTRWLSKFLKTYPGEIIAISHDRKFLDSFSSHSMVLQRQKLVKVPGTIDKLLKQVQQDDEIYEKTLINQERKRATVEKFIERFRYKASKAKQVQSRIKSLEKSEQLERKESLRDMEIDFRFPPMTSKNFAWFKGLSFTYGERFPKLFSNLNFEIKKGDRLGVIGPNGKGKTTLLKLINSLNSQRSFGIAEGETYFHKDLKVSYFGQDSIGELYMENTIEEEIRSAAPTESTSRIRAVAGAMLFSADDAQKKVKVLSGGERARVVLGKIMISPAHLILLDEPTNHLDVESIEVFLNCLSDFEGAIIFVSHDEDFVNELGDKFVYFKRNSSGVYLGDYKGFLAKIGWDDVDFTSNGNASSNDNNLSKKEITRLRQDLIREKSKVLKPITSSISKLEKELETIEMNQERSQSLLIEMSSEGVSEKNGILITDLSKEMNQIEKRKNIIYEELEKLMEKEELVIQEFDQKLSEL